VRINVNYLWGNKPHSWTHSKCSPNMSYFYYPWSAYMNWSLLFLSLEMNRALPQLLSHSFPTFGSHKMSHRGRNTFSSYARFIHLFIYPKILLWTFNKSVEKMNYFFIIPWSQFCPLFLFTELLHYYLRGCSSCQGCGGKLVLWIFFTVKTDYCFAQHMSEYCCWPLWRYLVIGFFVV